MKLQLGLFYFDPEISPSNSILSHPEVSFTLQDLPSEFKSIQNKVTSSKSFGEVFFNVMIFDPINFSFFFHILFLFRTTCSLCVSKAGFFVALFDVCRERTYFKMTCRPDKPLPNVLFTRHDIYRK
jgi:hypothetical protein